MMRKRIRRREAREALERIELAGELVKVIRRFFPISWICSNRSTTQDTKAIFRIRTMCCS